jgi:hypothetical protein
VVTGRRDIDTTGNEIGAEIEIEEENASTITVPGLTLISDAMITEATIEISAMRVIGCSMEIIVVTITGKLPISQSRMPISWEDMLRRIVSAKNPAGMTTGETTIVISATTTE